MKLDEQPASQVAWKFHVLTSRLAFFSNDSWEIYWAMYFDTSFLDLRSQVASTVKTSEDIAMIIFAKPREPKYQTSE